MHLFSNGFHAVWEPCHTCGVPLIIHWDLAIGAYKRREFKPLPTMAKGVQSAPCAGMDVIPTRPRQGSPRGAKCERIALLGYYSAGAIVRCTNGIDVRKSLDKNSCPRGTKIFSPATRSDWKTFLASAGSQVHFMFFLNPPTCRAGHSVWECLRDCYFLPVCPSSLLLFCSGQSTQVWRGNFVGGGIYVLPNVF